jgi:tetratricopeptide (TPR) repeat protein
MTSIALLCVLINSGHAQQPDKAGAHRAALADAGVLMRSGLAAAQSGDYLTARHDFEQVVRLAPQVEAGHAALGSVLLGLGEYDKAATELTLAHKLSAEDDATTLNLARAEVAQQQYARAAELFGSVTRKPTAPALSSDESLAYATALRATQQTAAALQVLRQAIAADPQSAALQDALGATLAEQGHEQQALAYFDQAIALDAKNVDAREHRAAALLAIGQPEQAVDAAELATLAAPQRFDAQLMLGRALSAAHRDTEALVALHRAVALHPEQQSGNAIYALALALQASGDAKGALPIFKMALAPSARGTGFDRSSALINYALAHVQTGDADGALPLYAEALRLGPDTPTLREDYGAAYLQKADLNAAIGQFQDGLKLEPDNALLHYDLGLAYKLQDNLTAAVPEFERAATLDSSLPDPPYTLGVIYMQQGRFTEAATSLRHAVALNPQNGDAWALLGSVLKDSGNPDDAPAALAALKKAIALEPDQPSLHIQVASLDMEAGDHASAAAERKIAAELSRAANDRQRASFTLRSGRALLQQGQLDQAIIQLKAATQADPTLAEPHALLAEIYTRQGQTAEAAIERAQANQLSQHP